MKKTDALIIGAGPTGLFTAHQLKIIGLSCEIVDNLNLAKNFIRNTLGQRIEMRRIPEMIFKDDTVLAKGLSVLKLLEELKPKTQNPDSKI